MFGFRNRYSWRRCLAFLSEFDVNNLAIIKASLVIWRPSLIFSVLYPNLYFLKFLIDSFLMHEWSAWPNDIISVSSGFVLNTVFLVFMRRFVFQWLKRLMRGVSAAKRMLCLRFVYRFLSNLWHIVHPNTDKRKRQEREYIAFVWTEFERHQ